MVNGILFFFIISLFLCLSFIYDHSTLFYFLFVYRVMVFVYMYIFRYTLIYLVAAGGGTFYIIVYFFSPKFCSGPVNSFILSSKFI